MHSGYFETIQLWSDSDIAELKSRHRIAFKLWRTRGYGFWVWKPYVILKRLEQLADGEILIYADQGIHILPNAQKRLDSYLQRVLDERSWVGVFGAGQAYTPQLFVKSWAIRRYLPSFRELEFGQYVMAGLLIIRNSELARRAMADWLNLCETRLLVQPIPFEAIYRKKSGFIGQDGDNGFLPLVLAKMGKFTVLDASEVNLINRDGIQLAHILPREDFHTLDWSSLNGSPFQYRRDR